MNHGGGVLTFPPPEAVHPCSTPGGPTEGHGAGEDGRQEDEEQGGQPCCICQKPPDLPAAAKEAGERCSYESRCAKL